MTEKEERKNLTDVIIKYLELNIENCKFMKRLYASNKEATKVINKSINQSKKALEEIYHINHIEVLRALYADCVGQVQGHLMVGGTLITAKTTYNFDKTEEGFEEFKRIQEENRLLHETKMKEQKENAELIKKAKEEGKKVEYVYDPVSKKARPMIVEENNNA